MRVLGVQEDAVRVPEQLLERVLVLVRVRVLQQAQVQVRGQGPRLHHSLWLRWQGSKMNFSSIGRRRFSKLHRRRCANC